MLVSIVIPNWNGLEFLKVCFKSLAAQTFREFEIILVDNGSRDGSVEFVKEKYPLAKIIELPKNIGFSPAVNLGIKESQGKYIFLLNNDTKVDKDCLKYLVAVLESKKDVGMVAAKMLQFKNPTLIDSVGDYVDVVGHANNLGYGEKDGPAFNQAGEVFLVTGGGSLFRKELFDKVGLFDDDYFAYMEDVDLCLRAQFLGFKGWFEPRARIYHVHKATSSRNKALAEYWQFRNMTMTIIKDFPKELLLKDFNWLKILLVNLNTVRYQASQGYLESALKAEGYVLWNLGRLLVKRRKIQSNIKVPMEYIIENVREKKLTFFGILNKGKG